MSRRVTSPSGAQAPGGREPAAPLPGGLNRLFYGDNLDVLRRDIADESVDLVYLDPPFNSQRTYSVLFKEKSGKGSQAQLEAFDDTWTWSHDADALYGDLMSSPTHRTRQRTRSRPCGGCWATTTCSRTWS